MSPRVGPREFQYNLAQGGFLSYKNATQRNSTAASGAGCLNRTQVIVAGATTAAVSLQLSLGAY